MTILTQPEPWLRGPVDGFELLLMPVVHALIQVREDIENLVARVPAEHTWERSGGAASIGFHVRHLGGALDSALHLCPWRGLVGHAEGGDACRR